MADEVKAVPDVVPEAGDAAAPEAEPAADQATEAGADAAEASEKPKRPSDEEILARPPPTKVPEPDRAARDAKMDKLHNEMANIKIKLEDIRKTLEKQSESKGENRAEVDAAFAKFNTMKEALKMKRAELDKVQEKLEKAKEAHGKLIAGKKEQEKRLAFTSSDKIEVRIADLEKKIATSSMTLKEEKDLVVEINKLKASKASVKEYDMHREAADKVKADRDRLNDMFKSKLGEVKDLKKVVDKYFEEYKVVRDQHRASGSDLYKSLTENRAKLRKRRDELWKESLKVKEEYNVAFRAYRKYRREMDDIKFAKRRQERAAYEAERQAREAEEEAEYADVDPWGDHKFAVQTLLGYLAKYMPKEDAPAAGSNGKSAVINDKGEVTAADDAVAKRNDFSGMVALKKQDAEYFAGSTKSKKKNNKKSKPVVKSTTIPLDPESIASFAKLGVTPPTTLDQVPAAVAALKEKQEYYKTAPVPEKTDAKAADAAPAAEDKPKKEKKQPKQKAPKIDSAESFPTLPGAMATPAAPVAAGAWS